MAKSEQEIRNLITELNKLSSIISTVSVNLENLNDIRMSDGLNRQINDQISLLRILQEEYRNVGRTILETSRFQLPANVSSSQYDPSVNRFRNESGRFVGGQQGPAGNIIYGQAPQQPVPYSNMGTGPAIHSYPPSRPMLPSGQQQLQLPAISSAPIDEYTARRAFEEEYVKLVADTTKGIKQPSLSGADRIFEEEVDRYINKRLENFFDGGLVDAKKAGSGGGGGRLTEADFIPKGTSGYNNLPGYDSKFTPNEIAALNSEYGKAIKLADQYGYGVNKIEGSLGSLKDVQKESTTGISRLRFQMEKMPGVFETLSIATDKYGNVLQDSQKRFRSFGSTILRNIAEVAKWTIAIQVIYAPMKKFQELMDIMIANEAKLADITVAVGKAQADTSKIFADAAKVADATGESINGVLEGYELAYRAAGSISDPVERAATANALLADSMILSKLSSLDQAQALDTLVGALNQLDMGLTDGRVLIDKWVKVANNANVSLATLAESFAITAASATNAGVSVDELNGIIATVAENTTLSATEAGNAVRAFISGFQTDKAQKELSAFGIALKDTSGEVVGFYDVMLEIYQLQKEGLISDSEFNKIGEAIGGGARRGAQVVTTIENLGRVQEVAAVSATAHGDAEEALGIKLDTVQTKITQMGNSFQSLAQTLGSEGGILDVFSLFADIVNKGLTAIDSMASTMGNALPIMLAFGLALQQINKGGAFSQGVQNAQLGIASKFAPGKLQNFLASTTGTHTLLGGLGVAAQAGTNLLQEQETAAAGNVLGGIIGGAIGAVFGPLGISIGSQIGSAIAGSFVTNVLEYEGEFGSFFTNIAEDTLKSKSPAEGKSEQELLNEARQSFTDEMTGGTTGQAIGAALTQAIYNGFVGLYNTVTPKQDEISGITREQAGITWSLAGGDTDVVERLKLLQEPIDSEGNVKEGTSFAKERNDLAKQYAPLLSNITTELKEQAQQQIATGDISIKQYDLILESLGGLDIKLAGFYTAFGDGVRDVNPELETAADLFQFFADVVAKGTEEDITYLSGLQTELVRVTEILDKMGSSADSITIEGQVFNRSELEASIGDINKLAVGYFDLLDTQQRFDSFKMPSIVNVDATQQDFQKILDYAEKLMQELYEDLVENDLIDLTLDEWRSTFEGFFVDLGGENGRQYIEGFSPQLLIGAQKALEDMGEILSSQSSIGLKSFTDLTTSQLQSLAAQSLVMNEQLKAQYGQYGYEGDTETFIGVAKDGIAGPITAELTIMQMLMRDLIDVSEEQLEGIYNLPTDGSFFVPFTGYALGQGGGGGGGGVNPLDNLIDTGQDVPQEVTVVGTDYKPSPIEQFYANQAQGLNDRPASVQEPEGKDMGDKYAPTYTNPNNGGFLGKISEFFSNFSIESLLSSLGPALAGGFAGSQTGASSEYITSQNLKSMEKTAALSPTSASLQELSYALAKTPINTNFNLSVSSNTQLMLDGQIVANVVKQYLQEELIRQEGTSTITRGVII